MSANRLTMPIRTTNVSARFAADRDVGVVDTGAELRVGGIRACLKIPFVLSVAERSSAKSKHVNGRMIAPFDFAPLALRSGRTVLSLAAQNAEFGRQDRVEHLQVFLAHAREHLVGGLAGHHEIHAHGFLSGEFEEVCFVGDAVAAVARDGTERGAAGQAELLGFGEQPVVQQHPAVAAVFVREETQVDALGGCGIVHAKCLNRPCISAKPKSVIPSVPITCTPMMPNVQPYWPRNSRVMVSPENVEKVVSPPRKPVVMNTRVSGDSDWNCANAPRIRPMSKPPRRLAASVPSGTVGKIGLNQTPKR